jgi:putative thioredoxin
MTPIDATEETFAQEVIARSAELPVLVDFWADWCAPCHALAPVIEAAIAERAGAVALVKVDVDANPALSATYSVSGIPAVKAFRDGRVVAEFTGARSRPAVDLFLEELLAPPRADMLVEELRSAGELPEVVAYLDANDIESALRFIVEEVPAADGALRERLREVAVALFERLGPDDPLTSAYRRRLASALY